MNKCPVCRQIIKNPLKDERNPNHPVTEEMRELWHKLLAITMWQNGLTELVLTAADIDAFNAANPNVTIVVHSHDDCLRVRLADENHARQLIKEAGGLPV